MLKTILITGGAGFIGSSFVPYFCAKYPQYRIINVDKLTYAGNLENLRECENMSNYSFEQANEQEDIVDAGKTGIAKTVKRCLEKIYG